MTLSGFGKDEILRTLAWRPIAVAAMASSSKVICGGLIMQKIHGLSLFEGDDDNCLFTVLGLPTPASWQGDHTQIVVAAMAGVWHASIREVILGTENGQLHEIAVDEKDKREKYIKFLFELSEYPEAFEGLQVTQTHHSYQHMIFQRRRRCPVNKSFSKCLWIRLTILNEKEDQFSTLGQKICCSEIVALDAATLRQSLHTGNKRLSTFNNFR
ncbi:hypothetical protein Tco_1465516 [Tanacetum coccineum]